MRSRGLADIGLGKIICCLAMPVCFPPLLVLTPTTTGGIRFGAPSPRSALPVCLWQVGAGYYSAEFQPRGYGGCIRYSAVGVPVNNKPYPSIASLNMCISLFGTRPLQIVTLARNKPNKK